MLRRLFRRHTLQVMFCLTNIYRTKESKTVEVFSDSPVSNKDILGITSNIHSIESMTDKLFEYSEDCHEEIPDKIEPNKEIKVEESTKNIRDFLIHNDELD
uniref:Uncharacterized protein n=1 Tax=Strongyloides papillosus TaxID=174720 RepID=A0A0N5BRD3_STREA